MNRFDKQRRLVCKLDFENVFNRAKKVNFGHVTVLYKENMFDFSRLGFAISKRFVRKAVLRNQIKRILRESFRMQSLPAYDIVILLNKACDQQQILLIQKNINQLWKKLEQH